MIKILMISLMVDWVGLILNEFVYVYVNQWGWLLLIVVVLSALVKGLEREKIIVVD